MLKDSPWAKSPNKWGCSLGCHEIWNDGESHNPNHQHCWWSWCNRISSTPFPRFQLQTRYASKAVAGKPLQTGALLFVHLIWSGHTELLTNVDISGKSLDHILRSRSTVSTCSFGSCPLAMWATSMCPVSNHASTRSGAVRLQRLQTMAAWIDGCFSVVMLLAAGFAGILSRKKQTSVFSSEGSGKHHEMGGIFNLPPFSELSETKVASVNWEAYPLVASAAMHLRILNEWRSLCPKQRNHWKTYNAHLNHTSSYVLVGTSHVWK